MCSGRNNKLRLFDQNFSKQQDGSVQYDLYFRIHTITVGLTSRESELPTRFHNYKAKLKVRSLCFFTDDQTIAAAVRACRKYISLIKTFEVKQQYVLTEMADSA